MEESIDLVNQIEEHPNYDEYNQNNKLVNDISYSYKLNNNIPTDNNSNNSNNFDLNVGNIQNQTIEKNKTQNRRYNSQLTQIDQNIQSTINNKSLNNNNDINYSGLNFQKMSSTLDIRLGERERKKKLLNNMQAQITLRKKTKLEELQKRREEDAQYLRDMILRYPFCRGGGGAPIRDKSGNIVTYRRDLISNPKYNQSPINVDDDFDEVWGKEKKLRKYNKNEYQNINNNNDDFNNDNTIRPFSTNPQINTIKSNTLDFNHNQNKNIYGRNTSNEPNLKQTYNFSTNNLINNRNNLNTIKYSNLNNSENISNLDNIYYKKILERKKKELELEKQLENMEKEQLKEDINNNNQNNKIFNLRNGKKRKNDNVINEIENDNDNEIGFLNKKDYYDNYNFVPKGKIHPRLENSFLFTDEINKLKNDIRVDQNALLDEIKEIKKDAKKAKKERKKVIKDLEFLKNEINRINNLKSNEEENEKEDNYVKKFINNDQYDEYIENLFNRKQKDKFYYIDDSTFQNYENELPNESYITKQKNILNIKKNYMDENQMELEDLIKKSNDILENLRDNEKIENEYKRKPEDYFNTSDNFYYTYRLNHANDYKDYEDNYNYNFNNDDD